MKYVGWLTINLIFDSIAVFNSITSACDYPANVAGCETYYAK